MFVGFLYLASSFVHMTVNPNHWAMLTRILFVVAVLVLIIIANLNLGTKKGKR